jgi:hypothetical protein
MSDVAITPTTPVDHAQLAAEAIRSLNLATMDATSMSPLDVYHVLGALSSLQHRLDQSVRQLHRSVESWIGDAYSDDPRTLTVEDLHDRITLNVTLTLGALSRAANALDAAFAAAGHLGLNGGAR